MKTFVVVLISLLIFGGIAIAWRDFHHQSSAPKPAAVTEPEKPEEKKEVVVTPTHNVTPPAPTEPEERLAYAPKDGLTFPKPAEPPKTAPVPSVTDSVPPPPADKPPTPPATGAGVFYLSDSEEGKPPSVSKNVPMRCHVVDPYKGEIRQRSCDE